VSHRPLALVAALTGGDFLLWNWSLDANHTVPAVIAGLTLPPLVAACALMLVLTTARLVSQIRAPAPSAGGRSRRSRRRNATAKPAPGYRPTELTTQPIRATNTRRAHSAPAKPAPANAPSDHGPTPVPAANARSPKPARKLAA
jgi:hypothetical protein